MKIYLSMGMGVNSVAMMLNEIDKGTEFESVFVDHGCDWPETYEYLKIFQEYLSKKGHQQIKVLKPDVQGSDNLYDHCWKYKMVPFFMMRWCTAKFKINVIHKYCKGPAFQYLGIDYGEAHRAKIAVHKKIENRYPLVESEINREGCKQIIRDHGLPVPMKSGCYICPFQRVYQWKELRMKHPDLFCKAERLEERNIQYRLDRGKKPLFLNQYPKGKLRSIVDEKQMMLLKEDEYPPCQCGL